MVVVAELNLPIIDLSSSDLVSTATCIRQACVDYGFFYVVNHGVDEELLTEVFDESKNFFSLPEHEKMKMKLTQFRGYTPAFNDKLNPSLNPRGDVKESFYIGPIEDAQSILNQWPSQGQSATLHEGKYGVSPHSDFGMITLLVTDGVRGLQICREKDKEPQIWEDVRHINGAFIVNIGDIMERWTNCLFRSTLHRVLSTDQERYSVAFFLDPNEDFMVECLETCCSEVSPPRFPPIRIGDWLHERYKPITHSS